MSQNEFVALKESVSQHGLFHAIVVNEDRILLDGHHRYEICKELDIEPEAEVRSFSDPLHEKIFIYESAGKRRHLNEWQKIELAVSTEKLLKEIANQNRLANLKQNQNNNRHQFPTRSNERVGDVAEAVAQKCWFISSNI